jgi:hypothetical protein
MMAGIWSMVCCSGSKTGAFLQNFLHHKNHFLIGPAASDPKRQWKTVKVAGFE